MKNSEEPAFASAAIHDTNSHVQYRLTKREHFAAMAMQAILSNPSESGVPSTYILEQIGLPKETTYIFTEHYPKYIAKISIGYSDELLKQLES